MKFQDGIKIMKTQKEKNTKKKRKSSKEVIPSGAWAVIRETALKFNILLFAHLRPSFLYFTQIWLWPICQQKNKVFYDEFMDQGAFSGDTPNWNWRAYLIKRPSISFVPSCSYLKLMDTTTILTSWSWLSLFIERPCVLRWLPSYQWRCPELAGLPHQTTLPPLAYWSLDSLESYLPIQHRWPRI